MLPGLHLVLAAIFALAPTPAPTETPMVVPLVSPAVATRQILVLNEGNSPIFSLRIGGGPDLLSFDRVIDVSEGQEIDVTIDPSACKYDVMATYRNGHVELQRALDLCHVSRITFTY